MSKNAVRPAHSPIWARRPKQGRWRIFDFGQSAHSFKMIPHALACKCLVSLRRTSVLFVLGHLESSRGICKSRSFWSAIVYLSSVTAVAAPGTITPSQYSTTSTFYHLSSIDMHFSVLFLAGLAAAAEKGSTGTINIKTDAGLGGKVTVVNNTAIMIEDYTLKSASAPALHWWGSTGEDISKGFRVNNMRVSTASPDPTTIMVALDAGKTAEDFTYFGLWCEQLKANFGEAKLESGSGSSASSTATMASSATGSGAAASASSTGAAADVNARTGAALAGVGALLAALLA